jgi:hypothetical protein
MPLVPFVPTRLAVPVPTAVAAATASVIVALAGFAYTSGTPPVVLRVTELTLAGGAAYLLDDPASPVTTPTPRPVWRRRAPQMISGGAVLVVAWLVVVVLLSAQGSDLSTRRVAGELAGLTCLAVAASAVCIRRGDREPGNAVATGVLLLGLAVVMGEAFTGVSVFVPFGEPAAVQQVSWLAAALAGCVVAAIASREPGKR